MTDEEPVIVGRELHDEIVADGEYMAVIGPFLFRMLILEAKVVQLVVDLFASSDWTPTTYAKRSRTPAAS